MGFDWAGWGSGRSRTSVLARWLVLCLASTIPPGGNHSSLGRFWRLLLTARLYFGPAVGEAGSQQRRAGHGCARLKAKCLRAPQYSELR